MNFLRWGGSSGQKQEQNIRKDILRTLEGRQQELREAQNRLAEARVAALKQEAEVGFQRNWEIILDPTFFYYQERAAARRLEAAARELEAQKRQKAMDISGNKLDLSGEARKNKVIVF